MLACTYVSLCVSVYGVFTDNLLFYDPNILLCIIHVNECV